MNERQRIIVVGGSLAGHSAVAELVCVIPGADIVWVTGEDRKAYSKPALSKEFMQARRAVDELLLPEVGGDVRGLTIMRGRSCVSLDLRERTVGLDDGTRVAFDYLVIATGAVAILPTVLKGIGGVFTLRTLDDAIAIRANLSGQRNVVIVGGGLIGCELAASMRGRGLSVILIEQLKSLLERPFGGVFGSYLIDLHRQHAVEVILGVTVENVSLRYGRVASVELSNGGDIETGLVLVGAGSKPCTKWLEGSGLAIDDGVLCDPYLEASHSGIFAAGDIARWTNPIYGFPMRVEHWANASAQGRTAARNIAAAVSRNPELRMSFSDVPYFWSDQYGRKIQMVGLHDGYDRIQIDHANDPPMPLARFYRNDRMIAAAGINLPHTVMRLRRQIEQEALARLPG